MNGIADQPLGLKHNDSVDQIGPDMLFLQLNKSAIKEG
jgi:hypothetical protein